MSELKLLRWTTGFPSSLGACCFSFCLCSLIDAPSVWAQVAEVQASQATGGPSAEPPAGDNPLATGQSQLAKHFLKLEGILLRSAEIEATSNPTRAALMVQAATLAKEVKLGESLVEAARSLERKQYSVAVETQKANLDKLNKILELLQSENRSDRLRNQRDQIKRTIEETERLLRLQSSLRGRTEGGIQTQKAASDQQKLADKAAQIAKDLNPDADKKSEGKSKDDANESNDKQSDSDQKKDGQSKGQSDQKSDQPNTDKKSNQKDMPTGDDGKPNDSADDSKSPQSPDSQNKDDKNKDGNKDGNKDSDNKDGKNKDSKDQGSKSKQGENKDSKEAQGKPSGDKPNSDDSSSKKSKLSEGDKQDSANPAQKSPSKDSQSQPGQFQPGQSQPGQSQQSQSPESQPDAQPQPPKSPTDRAIERMKQAQKNMEEAQKDLEEAKREGAVEKQRAAEQELKKAKEELEEILRQLREEEIERSLTALEERLRLMLQLQNKVLDETKRLNDIGTGGNDRQLQIRANALAADEKKILGEGQRALLLLREEGTSAAFPESLSHIIGDMQTVLDRLTKADVGKLTIGIETDIVSSLEELVAAMSEIKKENKERKENPPQSPGGQGGQPGEQPLVSQLAEMRLIKTLQLRINKRTQTLADVLKDPNDVVGQAEVEDIQTQLQELADRQSNLKQVTRDIVTGKGKQ